MSENQLRQVNASYVPEQDRLLLKINTASQMEFRFWITRRYLALLWPVLRQIAGGFGKSALALDSATRAEVANLAHQEVQKNMDISTQYQDGNHFPLGEEPVLLVKIATRKPDASGNRKLSLLPDQGRGIDLNLDESLTHSLMRVLQEPAAKADWSLDLNLLPDAGLQPVVPPAMLH